MDINQKNWANQVLQTLENAGFDISPFGEELEFMAIRGESLSVLISFCEAGLVFSQVAELISSKNIDETLNSINRGKGLLKAHRGFDSENIFLTFCYPMYADPNNVFEMAFLKYIDECNEALE